MSDEKIISTGRGGAGNVRSPSKIDQPEMSDALPKLHGKRFTTGRGGAGNMMDNIDPDSTRAAQDEGAPELEGERLAIAPTASNTVGRGGYGNNIRGRRHFRQRPGGDAESGEKSLCEKITSALSSS